MSKFLYMPIQAWYYGVSLRKRSISVERILTFRDPNYDFTVLIETGENGSNGSVSTYSISYYDPNSAAYAPCYNGWKIEGESYMVKSNEMFYFVAYLRNVMFEELELCVESTHFPISENIETALYIYFSQMSEYLFFGTKETSSYYFYARFLLDDIYPELNSGQFGIDTMEDFIKEISKLYSLYKYRITDIECSYCNYEEIQEIKRVAGLIDGLCYELEKKYNIKIRGGGILRGTLSLE